MENQTIKIFATSWCGASRRARLFFEANKIPYEWIDIDLNQEAAKFVESVNHGYRSVPTILFVDGTTLVEPTEEQLKERLNV